MQVKSQFEKIGLDRVVVRPATSGGGGFGGFGGGGGGDFDPFGLSERTKIISDQDIARWKSWPDVLQVVPEIDLPGDAKTGLTIGTAKNAKPVSVRIGNASGPRRGPFTETPEPLAGKLDLPAGRRPSRGQSRRAGGAQNQRQTRRVAGPQRNDRAGDFARRTPELRV